MCREPPGLFDVSSVEMIERRIVEDEDALVRLDERFSLLPEDLGIGLLAVQEPVERIVGRCEGRLGLHARPPYN